MQNIPPEIFRQLQEVICRPEGTVSFRYSFKDLFNPDIGSGIVFEIPSGEHLFRIERDEDLLLYFYHSSPGTGTRVAIIDLKNTEPADSVFLAFSWSTKEINFYVGPQIQGGELLHSSGSISKKKFRVAKDGSVFQIGDDGLDVMGINVHVAGEQILQSTALEAWNETKKAIEILGTGKSDQGYIFETTSANLTLAILVTGFEAYFKRRFLELEKEGIISNSQAVINAFYPKREIEVGIIDSLTSQANDTNRTVLELIVDRGVINFQNYDLCKKAYNKAYELKFGSLEIESSKIESLKKYIKFRHRIIHVSPLLCMLNASEVPPKEPEFSNKELANKALETFDSFINRIHEATLELKREE